ncbi:hypothetical protein ColLi_09053 [Colletotrichum liriopes]|uniref:C6 zinc finger protein n=1 Tax=Colletotrichum liriopes TaxID=708192 RepID=A0AA37LUU3_9PEZI|nr:hypothetical protein ColLi_09053 [Colletotrichum liriopes]
MHFYHRIAAPALAGSLNKTFWTTIVMQVSDEEPVAGHAVLALSSLYESFSKGVHEAAPFAVWHYNEAIKILRTTKDRALVLFACVIFICIELLRRNPQAAIAHCRHGINILNEIPNDSDFLHNHVVPTMRQFSLVPYYYGVDPKTFPTIDRPIPSANPQLTSIAEAHARQIPLQTRVARFLRIGEEKLLAEGCRGPEPDRKWTRNFILMDLDNWYTAFQALKNRHPYNDNDKALLSLLEIRHITSKIQLSLSHSKSECDYDAYLDDFRTVVELTASAAAVPVDPGSSSTRTGFTDDSAIEVGFSPLLFISVSKCRSLSVRITALKLMEQLARPRDNVWAKQITPAVARRIIEFEHRISLGDVETGDWVDDGELPPDERRVVNVDFWSAGGRERGSLRHIRFFVRDSDSGNLIVKDEWLKVEDRFEVSP